MQNEYFAGIVNELKGCLTDYLASKGRTVTSSGHFKCPLSYNHKHGDETPSCHITTQPDGTQTWYCHVCEVGGTIYDLAHYDEGLSVDGPGFVTATKQLAGILNIPLDPEEMKNINFIDYTDIAKQYEMYREIEYYLLNYGKPHESLSDPRFGRTYTLTQAGQITDIVAAGCVDYDELTRYMTDKFGDEFTETPLYKYTKKDGVFNKDTLTISYRDPDGNPIRFIGRRADDYINSFSDMKPTKYIQTIGLFGKKKEYPFLLDRATQYIKRSRQVIIVEGEFDTISMHLMGFKNTVGARGSSITEHFIDRLANMKITEAVLMLDPDYAGIKGVRKYFKYFLEKNIAVYVKQLPAGFDPDKCLTNNIPINLKEKVDALEYILRNHPDFVNPEIPEMVRYRNIIEFMADSLSLKAMLKKYSELVIAEIFGYHWEEIYQDIINTIEGRETKDEKVVKIHKLVESVKDAPLDKRVQVYEQASNDLKMIISKRGDSLTSKTVETYRAMKRNDMKLPTTLITGRDSIDNECTFLTGTISIWAGWPSNGKTSSIRNFALDILANNQNLTHKPLIVYFSLDDDERNTMVNFITMLTDTPSPRIKDIYSSGEWNGSPLAKRYDDEIEDMFKNHLLIFSTLDCPDVASIGRVLNVTSNNFPDRTIIAVVDALNNFVDLDKDNQIAAAEGVIREIKRYAGRYDAHISIIVHNKKHTGDIRRPRISDIKGSSFIEHEAQQVLLSYMETHYKKYDSKMIWNNIAVEGGKQCPVIELTIAKDKNHQANVIIPQNFNPYNLRTHEPNSDQMSVYMEEIKNGKF